MGELGAALAAMQAAVDRAPDWAATVRFRRPSHGGIFAPAEEWLEEWTVRGGAARRRFRPRPRGRWRDLERDEASGWWEYPGSRRRAHVPTDQCDVMVDPSLLLGAAAEVLGADTVAGRRCWRVRLRGGHLGALYLGDPAGITDAVEVRVDRETGVVLAVEAAGASAVVTDVDLPASVDPPLGPDHERLCETLLPGGVAALDAHRRLWTNPRRLRSVLDEYLRQPRTGGGVGVAFGSGGTGTVAEDDHVVERWWVALPGRFRCERPGGDVTAWDGDRWWSHDAANGWTTGHERTGGPVPAIREIVEPAARVASMSFSSVTMTGHLGRPALLGEGRVRARRSRVPTGSAVHRLGDAHRVLVDPGTGLLLQHQALWRGAPFLVDELTAWTVNDTIDECRFGIPPPE